MKDLHDAIINIPATVPDACKSFMPDSAYKLGHQDARHAAAELALQYSTNVEPSAEIITDERIAEIIKSTGQAPNPWKLAIGQAVARAIAASRRTTGGDVAELQNITAVDRSSDQSIRVSFTSARAASAFMRSLDALAAPVSAGQAEKLAEEVHAAFTRGVKVGIEHAGQADEVARLREDLDLANEHLRQAVENIAKFRAGTHPESAGQAGKVAMPENTRQAVQLWDSMPDAKPAAPVSPPDGAMPEQLVTRQSALQAIAHLDQSNSPGRNRDAISMLEPAEGSAQHPDDLAVDRFAAAMKAKMAKSRAKGRGGWDDPEQCSVETLQSMLLGHLAKGDPVDIGNFSMMLFNRGAPAVAAPERSDTPAPDEIRNAALDEAARLAGSLLCINLAMEIRKLKRIDGDKQGAAAPAEGSAP